MLKMIINQRILCENINKLKETGKKIYIVVKSDAYNVGMNKLIEVGLSQKITDFCTTELNDAIQMCNYSSNIKVLLLKNRLLSVDDLKRISMYNNISVTISSKWELEMLEKYCKNFFDPLKVQIEFDVGMCRNGFNIADFSKVINRLKSLDNIEIKGFYGHRGVCQDEDVINELVERISQYKQENNCELDIHFDSSENIIKGNLIKEANCIRVGGLIYGLTCLEEYRNPILKFETSIISITKMKKGMKFGYAQKKCDDERGRNIAIISGGYANGLGMFDEVVLENNKAYKIVEYNMEQCYIDLVNDYYEIGTKVSLFDSQKKGFSLWELKKTPKEVMTSIEGFERIFIND